MHALWIIFAALLFAAAPAGVTAARSVDGAPRFTVTYEATSENRGTVTITCSGDTVLTRPIGAEPAVAYIAAGGETGVLVLRFLESRRVAWSLNRALIVPVDGCRFGTPHPVVEDEALVYPTPVDEPDSTTLSRTIEADGEGAQFRITIETIAEKVFLDPDGGDPYGRFRRLWPDERFAVDWEALKLTRLNADFDEPTARWRVFRDRVHARDGWFRVDTPQSRSQEPLTR